MVSFLLYSSVRHHAVLYALLGVPRKLIWFFLYIGQSRLFDGLVVQNVLLLFIRRLSNLILMPLTFLNVIKLRCNILINFFVIWRFRENIWGLNRFFFISKIIKVFLRGQYSTVVIVMVSGPKLQY